VEQQVNTEHTQADGIMGLSNFRSVPNLLDLAHKQGQLVSPKFGFELGLKELKQKSYFLYNISDEELEEAVYVNASSKDYWTLPVREVKFGNGSYEAKHALVDSGTSLILLPPDMFEAMEKEVFSKYCSPAILRSSSLTQAPTQRSANVPTRRPTPT
jgi:hypothetical protein